MRTIASRMLSLGSLALGCGGGGSAGAPADESSSGGEAGATTLLAESDATSASTASTSEGSGGETALDSSTGVAPACGDGVVDATLGEECDDGNTEDGDACSATCTSPFSVAWTATYNGPDSFGDSVLAVTVDGADNIYALGWTRTDVANDVWLRQYAPDGTEGWTWTYDGIDGLDDFGRDIALHDSGDLVIVGSTASVLSGDDILILRLAIADQSIMWETLVQGSGTDMGGDLDLSDIATDMALAAGGDIVVTGQTRADGERYNAWSARYDADGNQLWANTFSGAALQNDTADAVAISAADHVIAAVREGTGPMTFDQSIREYDADGTELGLSYTPTRAVEALVVDGDGSIVMAGRDDMGNAWVARFDATFSQVWEATYDGPAGDDDELNGVALGANGDIYVAGQRVGVTSQIDAWVAKYDADGTRVWGDAYNGASNGFDEFTDVVLDAQGAIIVSGASTTVGQGWDTLVRKYTEN